MTDKELLELAAKAAGYEWDKGVAEFRAAQNPPLIALWIPQTSTAWDPLADDGQALRLAVKLDLLSGPEFWHERSVQYAMAAFSGDRQDPYAATRRAIVRAAAEIGRTQGAKP